MTPYEKPMECGNHEDVRWAALTGKDVPGLLVQAEDDLLQVSALPYADELMTKIEYRIDLPASDSTVLCIGTKTLGVGSASCGPRPIGRYRVVSKPAQFSYVLRLLPPNEKLTTELAKLKTPAREPKAWPNAKKLSDRRKWKVVSCTSYEPGEGFPEFAFDDDPESYWHSRWSDEQTKNPHELVIDFGEHRSLQGIFYCGRTENSNGRVNAYKVYFSEDGKQWGEPALSGKFQNNDADQQAKLEKPRTARYMKFVVESEVNNHPFASIAELDIIPVAK
jgi:beta-galactosidase